VTKPAEQFEYDVVVIGAGGAGMMCAAQSAGRGRRVALLDHSAKIGRKILISGGGRCNFTNINTTPANFVSKNTHFPKSALARFKPEDFVSLVKEHRIRFHEKKLGQLFCDSSAEQIVDLLVTECKRAGAQFFLECAIKQIDKGDNFQIRTSRGTFTCESLIVATGGLSIPKIGATGFGYQVARQFGLKIVDTAPALDGFDFTCEDLKRFADLTGISLDTTVTCNQATFRENILFTHTGLSGPASLQASLYWNKGVPIFVDVLPGQNIEDWLTERKRAGSKMELRNLLGDRLPRRFAERYCDFNNLDLKTNQLNERQIESISHDLHNWRIDPEGTVGYRKAEVTRGGVDTDELSSKTMECKTVPGLFFIGEVVDVTGQLGGFNFQWAWASAVAAGQHA